VLHLRNPVSDENRGYLQADCEKCFGLCCVALRFSSFDGFPIDKEAGTACLNLKQDFKCSVHESLSQRGLKGCINFDCFGAGQKISQVSFAGRDWRGDKATAEVMFKSFMMMMQLHELLWYLEEALTFIPASSIYEELRSLLDETKRLSELSPDLLVEIDINAHRASVNMLLLQASELVRSEARSGQGDIHQGTQGRKAKSGKKKSIGRGADLMGADLRTTDLRGANLRGSYLIAANLKDNDLSGADLIGVDFRDADLRGADLSNSIFLTQTQVNSAKVDASTKLPTSLNHPAKRN